MGDWMKWTGNITVRINNEQDTYSPGIVEVERYSEFGVALKFESHGGRVEVVVRMSPEECKKLSELLRKAIAKG